ncbi:hypothetical protein FZ983_17135 [Azospirillum sp. B21]|uniref:hypothetical protein n=1 Tax=Azospirillum sp. B21 TaxID=2607496 RepID=UPI0011EBF58C|nr:hypothetical protein [Azospirillum sp. B21]KAA0579047.1 hypothetical protein FZ983_17135 [Azospirillum sp. B21]
MRVLGAVVSSAFALTLCGAVHAQTFKTGNWVGSVHWQKDGSFSHCAISSTYNSGTSLLFMVDSTLNWRVGFANSQWKLTPGARINLQYWVDGAATRSSSAIVVSEGLAVIDLPPDRGVFDLFRRGNRLTAAVPNGPQLVFMLTGTSAGLQMILDCAEARGQYPRLTNAFQSAPPLAPPMQAGTATPQSTPSQTSAAIDRKLEAMRIVANVIAPVGLEGFRVLSADEIREAGLRHDAVWAAKGVLGMLDVYPGERKETLEQVASKLISDDGSVCKGEFLSGSTPDPASNGKIRRVYAQCRPAGAETINTFYTVAARPDGGIIQISLYSRGSDEPARSAETQLRSAVFKGM